MAKGIKTGGRKKGSRNKATAYIKALAQEHGKAAINKLVALMKGDDPRTAIAAAKELLDRGYGKSAQPVTGEDGEVPVITRIERVIINPRNPDG